MLFKILFAITIIIVIALIIYIHELRKAFDEIKDQIEFVVLAGKSIIGYMAD